MFANLSLSVIHIFRKFLSPWLSKRKACGELEIHPLPSHIIIFDLLLVSQILTTLSSHLEGALQWDQSERLLGIKLSVPEVEIREVVSARLLSACFLLEKEVMLYSTLFILMACDWSLAALSLVSHSQKYVGSSTNSKKDIGGEDWSPGRMHLLPIKVPLASLHNIRLLNPWKYIVEGKEGSIHHLKCKGWSHFIVSPMMCPAYRCNVLLLVPKVSFQHHFGIPSIR